MFLLLSSISSIFCPLLSFSSRLLPCSTHSASFVHLRFCPPFFFSNFLFSCSSLSLHFLSLRLVTDLFPTISTFDFKYSSASVSHMWIFFSSCFFFFLRLLCATFPLFLRLFLQSVVYSNGRYRLCNRKCTKWLEVWDSNTWLHNYQGEPGIGTTDSALRTCQRPVTPLQLSRTVLVTFTGLWRCRSTYDTSLSSP
jgi:hypothetical protein